MTRREREALRRAGYSLSIREACAEFVEDVRARPDLAFASAMGGLALGIAPAAVALLYMAFAS